MSGSGLGYWMDDVSCDDRFEKMNQEDDYLDLVERAEGICDNHTNWDARVLGRFVSSLRNAIANTSNEGLKSQMKRVRGRLLSILAVRNEQRVDKLLKDAGEMLDSAKQHLGDAMKESGSRETIQQFDMAEGCLRLAFDFLNEMQVRKYLQEFAKKKESEIFSLRLRLRELREENQKRPQIVRLARQREEVAAQELADRVQREIDEDVRVRSETIAACEAAIVAGDLETATRLFTGLQPIKVDLDYDRASRKMVRVPVDPEWASLESRILQLSITEATRLKGLVDECIAQRDFAGAKQHIDAIEKLDPRAITKVFMGPEQVAMLKQRCDRQLRAGQEKRR